MDLTLTGKRINELRTKQGMTLEELADKYEGYEGSNGASKIAKYEKGNNLTLYNIQRLADVLGCDPEYLLGCQEHPDANTSWIAEQVPMSGTAIQGLMRLKQDRDSDKLKELISSNPYSTFAEAIDYMICGMLDSAGYYDDSGHYEDYDNNQTHALIFDLIKSAKALKKMDEIPSDQANSNPYFGEEYNNTEMAYRGILFNLGQELSKIIAAYVDKHIYESEEA